MVKEPTPRHYLQKYDPRLDMNQNIVCLHILRYQFRIKSLERERRGCEFPPTEETHGSPCSK